MTWFILALIAPLIWACVNLLDDHLLKNVFRSATFAAAISGILGLLPAIYIYIVVRPEQPDLKYSLCAVAAGAITILFRYFYFKTLENDEPSVAVALNNLAPAIVPFLAFFILKEQLAALQYVGLAMMLFGSFVLAAVDIKNFRFTSAVWFALYGAIVYAVVSIFAKYAYNGASFSGVFLWVSIGFGVGGLIAFVLHKDKKQFRILFTQRDKKIPLILLGDELLEISGELVQGAAIHGGPVTVVRGLEGIQPLYVLAIGIILSQFFPRYFRERRDERFRKKVLCMIFMIVGLFMI